MDPFIGQIMMFGGNFAPRGWALCNGQLLSIAQNSALFSILGTTYGGDGRSTFGLPDLRGRAPIHAGSGAGLTPRSLGQRGGAESVQLTVNNIPAHNHQIMAPDAQMKPVAGAKAMDLSNDPPGTAHDNMPPYLAINYVIALVGIFPSRS